MSTITSENVLKTIHYGTGENVQLPLTNPYASTKISHSEYDPSALQKIMTEWGLGQSSNAVSGNNPSIQHGRKLYDVLTQIHKELSNENQGRNYDAYSVLKDMCRTGSRNFNFNLYPIGYAKYVLDFECRSWYLMIFSGPKKRATWMPLEMINFLCWNHPKIMKYLKNTGVDPLTQVHTAPYSEGVPYIGWHVNQYSNNRFNTVSKGYPSFAMALKIQARQRKKGKKKNECSMQIFGCGCRDSNNILPEGDSRRTKYEYEASSWHEDHIVPISIHGKDNDFNKQELCNACHIRKSKWENALDFNSGSEPMPLLILIGHALYSMCLYIISHSRHDSIGDTERKKLLNMAGFDMNKQAIINAAPGTSLKMSHGSKGAVPVDFKPIATLLPGKTFQDVNQNFKWDPDEECVKYIVNHFELKFQASTKPSVVLTWREIIDRYVDKSEDSFQPHEYRPYSKGRPFGNVDGTVTFKSDILP